MHSKTLSGLAAVTVGVLAFLGATRSEATHTPVAVAIDVDVSGNAANSLGMTEACNAVGLEVGETLDIDVVVRGVPDGTGHGLGGVGFNLVFDPAVVQVDLIHAFDGPTLIGVGGVSPFVVLDYNFPSGTNSDPPPGVTGDVRSDMAGLGPVAAFGDGIVTRVTLRGVGEGITRLDLYDEMELPWRVGATVYTPDGLEYASTSEGAVIGVGRNGCDGQRQRHVLLPPRCHHLRNSQGAFPDRVLSGGGKRSRCSLRRVFP